MERHAGIRHCNAHHLLLVADPIHKGILTVSRDVHGRHALHNARDAPQERLPLRRLSLSVSKVSSKQRRMVLLALLVQLSSERFVDKLGSRLDWCVTLRNMLCCVMLRYVILGDK